MGTKTDQTIAYLGRRVGKLSDRCQALAQICNEQSGRIAGLQADVARVTAQQGRTHEELVGARLDVSRLEGDYRDLKADNERVRAESQGWRAEVAERDALTSKQAEELSAARYDVSRLEAENTRLQAWADRDRDGTWASAASGDPEYSLAGTPSVGTEVVSQHLVGAWKVLATHVDDTEAGLVRLGRTVGDETAMIVWDLGTVPLERARY